MSREVLLLGAGGAAARLLRELDSAGVSVEAHETVTRGFPDADLIVVAEPKRQEERHALIRAARAVMPGIPVAVLRAEPVTVDDVPGPGVALVVDVSEGLEGAVAAIRGHGPPSEFDATFAEELEQAAADALHEGFGARARPGGRYLRSQARLSGEVNAILPFGGVGVRGRLVVSGMRPTLEAMLQRTLDPTQSADEEHHRGVVGELANLTLGNLQRRMRKRGTELTLGYPLHMEGTHARLTYLGDRTNLVAGLEIATGRISFEACLYQSPSKVGPDAPPGGPEPGDLTFL